MEEDFFINEEEAKHFYKVINSFLNYKKDMLYHIEKWKSEFNFIPKHHQVIKYFFYK